MYKKIIPTRIKDGLKVLLGMAKALPINFHYCPVCSSRIRL